VHDGERRDAQPIERAEIVEVADDRHDAASAKPGNLVAAPNEAVQSRASPE